MTRQLPAWVVVLFAAGSASAPACGGIISDRSAFVGDFTVIDFETRGDGTPLDLREGGLVVIPTDEYAALGVNISTERGLFGDDRPILGNIRSLQADEAQRRIGSLDHLLADGSIPVSTLRFDFLRPVDAIGMALFMYHTSAPTVLTAFDSTGNAILSVEFGENLIDGTISGEDFDSIWDIYYGFAGIFSPQANIAFATLSSDEIAVDDLHFGTISEPHTLVLLMGAIAVILFAGNKRRARCTRVLVGPLVGLVCLTTGAMAQQEITGTVSAWVVDGPEPICGSFAIWGCEQVPLSKVSLPDTKVCVEGGDCVFTDADGEIHGLSYTGVDPVNVIASLESPFGALGFIDFTDPANPTFVPDAPESAVVFDPGAPAPVDIVLNPNPVPVDEISTAEAHHYYYASSAEFVGGQRSPE